MSDDLRPILKVCGSRTYRHYPVESLPALVPTFSKQNLERIGDDADELDAVTVNLESGQVEELENAIEEEVKVDAPDSAELKYDPRTQMYTGSFQATDQSQFLKLLGKPEQRKSLEDSYDSSIEVNKKTLEVKVRGACPESVAKLHYTLATQLSPETSSLYRVINIKDQTLIAELNAKNDTGQLEVSSEKNYFIARIPHFPRECANFLLSERGLRLKQLKSSIAGNIDFFVNKKTQNFEISGSTAEIVRAGYQAFVARLEEDPVAKGAFQGLSFAPRNSGQSSKPINSSQTSDSSEEYTHFLAFSFANHPSLINLQNDLKKVLDGYFWSSPNTFHFTMGMLKLTDERAAAEALNRTKAQLTEVARNQNIILTVNRLNYFGLLEAPKVIYAEPAKNSELQRLRELNLVVLDSFKEAGLISLGELKKQKVNLAKGDCDLTYHLTLGRKRDTSRLKTPIKTVFSKVKSFEIRLEGASIQVLSRNKPNYEVGYPVVASVSFAS